MVPRSLLFALALLLPASAVADVVRPPPLICPPGYSRSTDHSGPYCAPPLPRDCKAGYEPKVRRKSAYCEPPPAQPCPPGSFWTSTSETNTWCEGGWRCDQRACGDGSTCREEGLCVTEQMRWRGQTYEIATTTCTRDDDCAGPEETCVRAKRCEPDTKRQPASTGVGGSTGDDEVPDRPGCAVGGAPRSAWLALLLLPLAVTRRKA